MDFAYLLGNAVNIAALVSIVILGLVGFWVKNKAAVEALAQSKNAAQLKENIAYTVVIYVQQKFKNLTVENSVLLSAAVEAAIAELAKLGITVTEEEITVYIEAALKLAKQQFGDGWDTATN